MESNNNVLESLPEAQQLQVYELMGIANIEDGEVAAKLFIESNHDINRAVQRWFDRQAGGGMNEEHPYTHEPLIDNPPPIQNQPARPRESELHTQYRTHVERKTREEEEKGLGDSIKSGVTSVVSGIKSVWNAFVPIKIRGETVGGEQFIIYLQKNYPELVKEIKWNIGTFEENVEKAHAGRRPLLVYVHVDGNTFKAIPNNIFKDKKVINIMNTKFHTVGLLLNSEGSRRLNDFVETKNCPCLAVLRVNLMDQTVLVESVTLTNDSTPQEVLERLQNIERSYFLIVADEEKIKQDVKKSITQQIRNMQMNSPFFYAQNFGGGNQNEFEQGQMFGFFGGGGNPYQQQQQQRPQIRPEEQQRLEEARILRQIQEEEFKEVEKKILEQQMKQIEEEKNQKEQEENERMVREQIEAEERMKEEKKEFNKKIKSEALPSEPEEGAADAMLVIFRLPDGNRLERRFRITNKVQSLYDYVDTQDVQFDKSTVKYDLMQPRPFLCLEDKEKRIEEYFEGSNHEVIHVRELTA